MSKTVPDEVIRFAAAAGCTEFGENKVQEAKRKAHDLADLGVGWAVIGHLQTNKAKDVATFASEFQALDSLRLAEGLDRRLEPFDRVLPVYVQVNSSGEESKFGLRPQELLPFLEQVAGLERLEVHGLMTLALNASDESQVRRCFVTLRELRDVAVAEGLLGDGGLSMGMSGDFEWAVEEGSTVVRVGQAIFGARPVPDSHYWPAT